MPSHTTLKNTHTFVQRKFLSNLIWSFIWVGDVLQKDRSKGIVGLLQDQALGKWNTCQTCHVQFTVDWIVYYPVQVKTYFIRWVIYSLVIKRLNFEIFFQGNNFTIKLREASENHVSPRLVFLPPRAFTLFRQLLQTEPGHVLTLSASEKDFTAIHQLARRTNSRQNYKHPRWVGDKGTHLPRGCAKRWR